MELAALKSSPGELAQVRDDLDGIAQFHAKRGEKYDEAIALNDIGVAFYQEGRFDDALRLFRRTVPLYSALQEKPRQALVLQNIAAVEYELGRLSDMSLIWGSGSVVVAAGGGAGAGVSIHRAQAR